MKRGIALFAVMGVVGGAAGMGLVRAVEGSVRVPHAAAGWLVACAGAACARWINARAMDHAPQAPLWGLAANGLRWLALLCILVGYAVVFPAGFAAFGLTLAVVSFAFVAAEVFHLHGAGGQRAPGIRDEHERG